MNAEVITIGIFAALLAACQDASADSGAAQARKTESGKKRAARANAADSFAGADERVDSGLTAVSSRCRPRGS